MPIDWSPLKPLLENNSDFVLTSHVRPDADALGSELAMAAILLGMGKNVHIVNPGASPAHLKFLDPESLTKGIYEDKNLTELIQKCDVHIVLDTSAWGQIADVGTAMKKSEAKKVVIDHHASSDDLGALEFKDTSSPATGCLIHDLMKYLGHQPDTATANALYAAIATDTGWFRFPATNAETMETIADLMRAGAEPALLYNQLYEQGSLAKLHLSGIVLSRVALSADNQLAYTYVLQNDFKETKSHPADTESLVNECMRIQGTRAAFILVEQQNKKFKASLRSREGFDVTPIAERFGGGGHRQASGAMVPGPLENALKQVVSLYEQQFAAQAE